MVEKGLSIIQFVVSGIPLRIQFAWISTRLVRRVRAIQAISISVTLVRSPRTHDAKWLVIGDVGCKSSHFVQGQLPIPDKPHVSIYVVFPAQPATMCSIQIDGGISFLGEFPQGIFHSMVVRELRCLVSTMRMAHVGGKVGNTIGFHHQNNRDLSLESGQG